MCCLRRHVRAGGPNLDDSFAQARSEGFKESAIRAIVHDQIKFPGQYPTAQNDQNYLQANMPANLVTGKKRRRRRGIRRRECRASPFAETQGVSGHGGKRIFASQCGGCHTLKDAGTTGTRGPSLDQLKTPVRSGQEAGDHGGTISQRSRGTLTDAQIAAVSPLRRDAPK